MTAKQLSSGLMLLILHTTALPAHELEQRVRATIEHAIASVGTISALSEEGPRYGSGFVIDQQRGWLITNYHVVARARSLSFHNAQTITPIPLRLAYFEAGSDLALLEALDRRRLPPAIPISESGDVHQGQFVIAMGSPEGLGQTSTLGLISAIGRTVPGGKLDLPFLQIDAAVYEGSSGGPVCDLSGSVVGVVTRRAASGHAAFALPAEPVRQFLENYRQRDRPGNAQQPPEGYLGAELQALSRPLARHFDYAGPGVVIAGTYGQSAARAAGLEPGDVLVSLGDIELDAQNESAVPLVESLISAAGPGTHQLRILRGTEILDLTVELLAQPPCRSEAVENDPQVGLIHRIGHCYWFPQGEFVEITRSWASAGAASPAELAPLAGDLIIEVYGRSAPSEGLGRLMSSDGSVHGRALARVIRQGRPRMILIDRP